MSSWKLTKSDEIKCQVQSTAKRQSKDNETNVQKNSDLRTNPAAVLIISCLLDVTLAF